MSPPTTTTTLPAGRFGAILADPPWPYATYSARGKGRSAEAYYDTMSIDAIVSMPVASWAADDCVLLLWVTDPVLPRAFDVITVWASEYKTVGFTRLNRSFYFRQTHTIDITEKISAGRSLLQATAGSDRQRAGGRLGPGSASAWRPA